MASSSKRLQNDVLSYETSSDRKIPFNMYYIVCISLENSAECPGLVKKLIRQNFEGDGYPLAGYTYSNDVYLIFSSLESPENEHYLSGSHQKLCSYFSSTISRTKNMDVTCSIVELDSRTKVLVYFQTKIYENAKKTISGLLNNLSHKELETLSMFELLELLKKRSIDWSAVAPIERFGTFYKYVKMDGKEKLSTLSELFDVRNLEKYAKYLFK